MQAEHTTPNPGALTQTVSSFLYATSIHGEAAFDGAQFHSRYGDELTLIAIFERGTDPDHPGGIINTSQDPLRTDEPQLRATASSIASALTVHATKMRFGSCDPNGSKTGVGTGRSSRQ